MRILSIATLPGLGLAMAALLGGQTFDKSATGNFHGNYYLRQVLLSGIDTNTGAIGRARSLIGTAALDGAGNYSITGTLLDTQAGSSPQPFNGGGTLAVAANGFFQMDNPLDTQGVVDGGVGLGAFAGSATESNFQDLLVMIPAGTAAVTNNALLGSYRVGALEFLQGSSSFVRDAYFTLTSTGNGSLGTVSLNGSAANLGNRAITQTATGVTYSLAQAPGSITFPSSGGAADTQLISGAKTLFVSADGNLLLGGSPNGFDILIGIRAPAAGTQSTIAGTFYLGGLEEDNSTTSSPVIDAYYGSLNGNGAGINIWHQRINFVGKNPFDNTFSSSVTLDSTGAATKSTVHYDVGANGRALLLVGRTDQYALVLGLHADDVTPSGVFLNPVGIVNAAGFTPITSSVAPNELVSLFGSNLAAGTQQAQSLPFPKTLGGVQMTVNGRPAPLYFVSPQQISALVPSNLPETYATFQVTNNGVASNAVTVYTNNSSPAVFTSPANGVSSAAALHSDFSLVSASSPAKPGETILIYLTGLGAVSPAIEDGAAGPSDPLSKVPTLPRVFFGTAQGTVTFAGLAPTLAGLYQINVTLPANAPGGSQFLSIDTAEALNQESTIMIAGAASGAAEKAVSEQTPDSGYRPALARKLSHVKTLRSNGARR
ncbi:MAG: hypothetical protein ACR2NN_18640 [Bryobacteraceae bacterium]